MGGTQLSIRASAHGIAGIAGIIRHGSFTELHGVADVLGQRVSRIGALPMTMRGAIDGSVGSWAKGTALECAAERWLARHGVPIPRNISVDLVLRDGAIVRPDLLGMDARTGQLLIGEVKNLDHVALREQLRRYVDIARANDVQLHLFVPQHATFSKPLQDLVDEGIVRRISLRSPR